MAVGFERGLIDAVLMGHAEREVKGLHYVI
jgi:hypothetical protein